MALSYPTLIPALRSPSDQVNGLVYFGRMLDQIRLAAAGKLHDEHRCPTVRLNKASLYFGRASGTLP